MLGPKVKKKLRKRLKTTAHTSRSLGVKDELRPFPERDGATSQSRDYPVFDKKMRQNEDARSQMAGDVQKKLFAPKLERDVSDHTLITGSVEGKSTLPGTSMPNQAETASQGFTIGAFTQVRAVIESSPQKEPHLLQPKNADHLKKPSDASSVRRLKSGGSGRNNAGDWAVTFSVKDFYNILHQEAQHQRAVKDQWEQIRKITMRRRFEAEQAKQEHLRDATSGGLHNIVIKPSKQPTIKNQSMLDKAIKPTQEEVMYALSEMGHATMIEKKTQYTDLLKPKIDMKTKLDANMGYECFRTIDGIYPMRLAYEKWQEEQEIERQR